MPRDFLSWPQECPVSGLIRDCMGPEGRGPARAALARTGERVSDFPDASLHLLPGGCTASADSHSATGHALSLAPAPVTVIEFYPAAMARAEALIRSSKTAGSLITRNERRRRPSVVLARSPAHFLTGGNASEPRFAFRGPLFEPLILLRFFIITGGNASDGQVRSRPSPPASARLDQGIGVASLPHTARSAPGTS
jgi:hypothetical protein